MKLTIDKLKKSVWGYKQPLTKIPNSIGSPVSDMFLWRNSKEWKTFFELIDISGLFSDEKPKLNYQALIVFFNSKGEKILEENIQLQLNQKNTINLSEYLTSITDDFGSFCVFHLSTPDEIKKNEAFIAERGYVGYKYKEAPIRAFVHGNMDAIALEDNDTLDLLGGSSVLSREYRLQHEMTEGIYELVLTNITNKKQKISCELISNKDGKSISKIKKNLNPMGVTIFNYKINGNDSCRAVINSRMVMARPIVCHLLNDKLNVFHG